MGGLGIYLATVIAMAVFFPLTPGVVYIILAASALVCTGILDDIYDLKPLVKLAGQLIAAALVVLGNAGRFSTILSFLDDSYISMLAALLLVMAWIVLMINAFNLIDGLDGLAAGTAVIILCSMVAVSLVRGNLELLGYQVLVLGACAGFLPYNFQPAKIFMGDTGSMLLGFLLSVLFLYSITEPFSVSLVLGSAFIFAYPALDVAFAIYRRLRRGGSIFAADQGHIHHLLIRLGFSVRQAVVTLYLLSLFFGGVSVLILCVALPSYIIFTLGAVTVIGIFFLFRFLNRLSKLPQFTYRPEKTNLPNILRDRTVTNNK
ncbi:MAG TPA: MraY family glycosyltransferase [Bacillota bacterium]|nr:MraY family glycosyltransferase [Bacillota bacterium]